MTKGTNWRLLHEGYPLRALCGFLRVSQQPQRKLTVSEKLCSAAAVSSSRDAR